MDIFEGKSKFELTEKDIKKIFTANVDDLVEMCYPHSEYQCELFKLFGTRTGGISDNWIFTKNWKEYPEELKWRYIALCSLYWQLDYEGSWWRQYEENNRLKFELARLQSKLYDRNNQRGD